MNFGWPPEIASMKFDGSLSMGNRQLVDGHGAYLVVAFKGKVTGI
jgi:hypothetical protein